MGDLKYKADPMMIFHAMNELKEINFEIMKQECMQAFQKWEQKGEINLADEIENLVANINVHCFLGDKIREKHTDYIRDSLRELENNANSLFTYFYPTAPFGRPLRNANIRADLYQFFHSILEDRRANNFNNNDYLDCLIKHQKENPNFTDRHILTAILSIFFAAKANTVLSTNWLVLSILLYPEARENLCSSLVHQSMDWQGIKTNSSLDKLLKESSRFYNAPTVGARVVVGNDVYYKNYLLEKGNFVTIISGYNGMNSDLVKEPKKFDPERWERDNLDQLLYIPFSRGHHRCKGEMFAVQVIKTIVSLLFANYELNQKDTSIKIEPTYTVDGRPILKKSTICYY